MAFKSAMPADRGRSLRRVLWGLSITLLVAGSADCDPILSVYSPPTVIAKEGSNVTLNVLITGAQTPEVEWSVGGLVVVISSNTANIAPNYTAVVSLMPNGSLAFSNVLRNYSATYTVTVTKPGFFKTSNSTTLQVFARPLCSIQGVNGNLQYTCETPGDSVSVLSFPSLSVTTQTGSLSLTVPATQNNGKEIFCFALQISITQNCSVTARAPQGFLLTVSSTASNGTLAVTINCNITSVPPTSVTWYKGSQVLANGGPYQISSDTTQLTITNLTNLTTSDLSSYSFSSHPFGSQQSSIQLIGPTISGSSLISNTAGTIVTLTWGVPRTSIYTGFDIQMTGPDLKPSNGTNRRRKRAAEDFRIIAAMPSSARSKDLSGLDPMSNYSFRVVPMAGSVPGQPSQVYSVGPVSGQGLSRAAILGLAIGIPCGFLLLLLIIIIIIICCVVCRRRRRRQPKYPVPRASQKAVTGQTEVNAPPNQRTRGSQNGSPVKVPEGIPERYLTLPSTGTHSHAQMATAL